MTAYFSLCSSIVLARITSLFTTGPILGIDPITFTLQGMGICSLGAVSAWLVLRTVRRAPPREWMAYAAVPVDVGNVMFVGLLLGGVGTTAPMVFFIVVVMHGLLLHPRALLAIVVCASAAFVILDVVSLEPIDVTAVSLLDPQRAATVTGTGGAAPAAGPPAPELDARTSGRWRS